MVSYLAAAVVDEFNRPAPVMLDPDENDSSDVTRRQLLIGLVPSHKHHLSAVTHHRRHNHGKNTSMWTMSAGYILRYDRWCVSQTYPVIITRAGCKRVRK